MLRTYEHVNISFSPLLKIVWHFWLWFNLKKKPKKTHHFILESPAHSSSLKGTNSEFQFEIKKKKNLQTQSVAIPLQRLWLSLISLIENKLHLPNFNKRVRVKQKWENKSAQTLLGKRPEIHKVISSFSLAHPPSNHGVLSRFEQTAKSYIKSTITTSTSSYMLYELRRQRSRQFA